LSSRQNRPKRDNPTAGFRLIVPIVLGVPFL
jgi:hypothetical protein